MPKGTRGRPLIQSGARYGQIRTRRAGRGAGRPPAIRKIRTDRGSKRT